MDRPILFGLETEYSFTPLGPDGEVLDRVQAAEELLEIVRGRVPHIPDVASLGVFLGNGGRIYIDRGLHPEVSTPECSHPGEIVRHMAATERLLADAAEELGRRRPGSQILVSACSMDYSGTGESWGCHESYLVDRPPRLMVPDLIPHLVSRIIYTGGGGFHNGFGRDTGIRGLDFLISPRTCQVGATRFGERWFVSKPGEPLCEGYSRLHVPCGEGLRSALGTWLKMGTTALVVRMIQKGAYEARTPRPADPLAAMHRFARDPSCSHEVQLEDGRHLGAIAIQDHYLRAAEALLGEPFMPEWAPDVCGAWRAMLERLGEAPGSVATSLDWAIKLAIYEQQTGGIDRAFPGRGLGSELLELDIRFARLGPLGVFNQLRDASVLSEVTGPARESSEVLENPPVLGRAAKRGKLVRDLGGRGRFLCDWEGVIDCERGVFADLKDPYETEIRWEPIAEGSREWHEDGLVHRVRLDALRRQASAARGSHRCPESLTRNRSTVEVHDAPPE